HRCAKCSTMWCPTCGQALSGKKGFLSSTRDCDRPGCDGRTVLEGGPTGEDRDAALGARRPEGGGRSPTDPAALTLPRVVGGRIRFTPHRIGGPTFLRRSRYGPAFHCIPGCGCGATQTASCNGCNASEQEAPLRTTAASSHAVAPERLARAA